ncbi:gamma-glutamyltransferase family protein [Aspergillus fijiensis CBS 313.89]|uniref:Gamma-glutamyltranspeptidase n=1 Tax=Aspergillus fijiensis CBS 313.89 TaxID=1448319 RepID=A0A8G1VXA7_9EURO|nr:gamma-glutamyltranspeptidase [Aspergillus fijiensis CBS 313.89]RAK75183.1 gamma-glutamyltranspeptidase [Aspergillus fijiensis CBS 313.89]
MAKTPFTPFRGRRSVVHGLNGMVACSQPLAAMAGHRILTQGGNAADAAVAVAAALNATEPASTGIGGDMFCLFYDAPTKKISALNGSGRAPKAITLDQVRTRLQLSPGKSGTIPLDSILAVTTPGAAAGWVDTIERFGSGKLGLHQILAPAIEICERGFPVSEVSSSMWHGHEPTLRKASPHFHELLKTDAAAPDGCRSPLPGEVITNHALATTFRALATEGKDGFYRGRVADSIVTAVQDLGGFLTHEDLEYHAQTGSQMVDPICLRLWADQQQQAVDIWEHPPNGQGVVALMALGIMEELSRTGRLPPLSRLTHNSPEYLHALIECLRIAFSDAAWWVADPEVERVPNLISKAYLAERAKLYSPSKASDVICRGSPAFRSCDTVYFAVADREGNAASFINSNYHGFGTGIVPAGCGFTLQSRGANFSLIPGHPNVLAPLKRPYHTIIPAMATHAADGSLHTVFGVMGGFMQPQGHVQVLLNMLVFGLNPQEALDAPRICIAVEDGDAEGGVHHSMVYVEDGIEQKVIDELQQKGHHVEEVTGWKRELFGRGQVIRCQREASYRVYSGGSDFRGDGLAIPL